MSCPAFCLLLHACACICGWWDAAPSSSRPILAASPAQAKATISTAEADIPEELREELRARLKRIGAGIKGKKMLVDIDVETMSDKMKRLTSGTSTEGYGTSAPTEVRGWCGVLCCSVLWRIQTLGSPSRLLCGF